MRELCVIAMLICLGIFAESSARYVLNEGSRIYVEMTHEAKRTLPLVSADSTPEQSDTFAELTASSDPTGLIVRHH